MREQSSSALQSARDTHNTDRRHKVMDEVWKRSRLRVPDEVNSQMNAVRLRGAHARTTRVPLHAPEPGNAADETHGKTHHHEKHDGRLHVCGIRHGTCDAMDKQSTTRQRTTTRLPVSLRQAMKDTARATNVIAKNCFNDSSVRGTVSPC